MALPRIGANWFQQSAAIKARNEEAKREREFRKREAEKQFQRQLAMTIGGHIADVGSSFAKQAYQQHGQEQQRLQQQAQRGAELFGLSPKAKEFSAEAEAIKGLGRIDQRPPPPPIGQAPPPVPLREKLASDIGIPTPGKRPPLRLQEAVHPLGPDKKPSGVPAQKGAGVSIEEHLRGRQRAILEEDPLAAVAAKRIQELKRAEEDRALNQIGKMATIKKALAPPERERPTTLKIATQRRNSSNVQRIVTEHSIADPKAGILKGAQYMLGVDVPAVYRVFSVELNATRAGLPDGATDAQVAQALYGRLGRAGMSREQFDKIYGELKEHGMDSAVLVPASAGDIARFKENLKHHNNRYGTRRTKIVIKRADNERFKYITAGLLNNITGRPSMFTTSPDDLAKINAKFILKVVPEGPDQGEAMRLRNELLGLQYDFKKRVDKKNTPEELAKIKELGGKLFKILNKSWDDLGNNEQMGLYRQWKALTSSTWSELALQGKAASQRRAGQREYQNLFRAAINTAKKSERAAKKPPGKKALNNTWTSAAKAIKLVQEDRTRRVAAENAVDYVVAEGLKGVDKDIYKTLSGATKLKIANALKGAISADNAFKRLQEEIPELEPGSTENELVKASYKRFGELLGEAKAVRGAGLKPFVPALRNHHYNAFFPKGTSKAKANEAFLAWANSRIKALKAGFTLTKDDLAEDWEPPRRQVADPKADFLVGINTLRTAHWKYKNFGRDTSIPAANAAFVADVNAELERTGVSFRIRKEDLPRWSPVRQLKPGQPAPGPTQHRTPQPPPPAARRAPEPGAMERMSPEEAVFIGVQSLPLLAVEKRQVANTVMRMGAKTPSDVDAVLASFGLTPEFLASMPSRAAVVRMMQLRRRGAV